MEGALAQVELSGAVLRGQFVSRQPAGLQWCDRRLLARMNRRTLEQLRREIEPVTAADFIRFLHSWQHVRPGTQLAGREGLREVIQQLQGFEAAAGAWEQEILPARVADYDPTWLDDLCLGGEVVWGRFEPRAEGTVTPTRAAPIALAARRDLVFLLAPAAPARRDQPEPQGGRRAPLPAGGGRQLPGGHRPGGAAAAGRGGGGAVGAGGRRARHRRWLRGPAQPAAAGVLARRRQRPPALVRQLDAPAGTVGHGQMVAAAVPAGGRGIRRPRPTRRAAGLSTAQDDRLELLARQYVKRWGVVFRDLLRREPQAPPWRDLVRVYRRLEMRGELRGGRLVGGFVGEQFASPEAVESLRAIRRGPRNGEVLALSACDPLNLVGIITPGDRIPATLANTVVYKDGVPTDDTGHEAVVGEINPYPLPPRPSLSAG